MATWASFESLGFTSWMVVTTSFVKETVKAIREILQPIHMKIPTENTLLRP